MSPVGDESRRLRHLPVVTVLITVLNALMFLVKLAGGDAFINQWSLVPAHIVAGQELSS
jgi:membrane associated rhomboid family serine protease